MNARARVLIERYPALNGCVAEILDAFRTIRTCFAEGGKLLLCGNGGSAADAEHWAAELLKGFCRARPLSPEWVERLGPDLAGGLQDALPAIPLTGFPAFVTAFGNDVAARRTFAQLVWALGRPGDCLVGISTSGESENILDAVRVAKARGLATISLTGSDGGRLATMTDVAIRTPATETYRVQEFHLPIYHALCLMLEDAFFGAPAVT